MDGERAGPRGTPGRRASGEPPRGRQRAPCPALGEAARDCGTGRAGGAAGAPGWAGPGWAGLGWREEANRATLCPPAPPAPSGTEPHSPLARQAHARGGWSAVGAGASGSRGPRSCGSAISRLRCGGSGGAACGLEPGAGRAS